MPQLAVIAAYLGVLFLILSLPKSMRGAIPDGPKWRDVRVWAVFVIVAQIVVYAIWG